MTTTARLAELAEYRRIDNILAEMWGEFHVVDQEMRSIANGIKRNAEFANKSYNQTERRQAEYAERIAKAEARLGELRPVREEKREAATKFNDDNYTGWSRFFHVVHIHKSMHCSSFRPTTRVGWLPDVSGLTEAEAVAAHGETLCTICFPDAPTELTTKTADPSVCAGTGKYSADRRRYVKCPDCGQTVNRITGSGKIRKHKKA